MEFFIYCIFNDLFYCGHDELNFSSNFQDAMFFTGVSYALADLEEFIDSQDEFIIDDFVIYQKGDIC